MQNIYISLGYGCQIAEKLRDLNLRNFSLPFDWVIPHGGVSNIIKNNFKNFLPQDKFINSHGDEHPMNLESKLIFPHNTFPKDEQAMKRRIVRFMELLEQKDDQLIFLKRGHLESHHNAEYATKHDWSIKNDIHECEELSAYLKTKYPKLKFKIVLILLCSLCFKLSKTYNSKNILIYNCAFPNCNRQQKDEIADKALVDIIKLLNKHENYNKQDIQKLVYS